MKNKTKPAPWLYRPALRLLGPPVLWLFRQKIKRDPAVNKIKGPLIVVGNHPSVLDPFFMAIALPWLSINFVVTDIFFRNSFLSGLLKLLGAVPKVQFRSDAKAVKQIFRIIRNGGVIGIFPEGQRSADGANNPLDEAMGRLIKKLGCNVLLVKNLGSYLTWPRWSSAWPRLGRVDTQVSLLFTPEEIKQMTPVQITEKLNVSLTYNDYEWLERQKKPIIWLGLCPAAGLHNVLHQCMHCQEPLSMVSKGRKLYCSKCDSSWLMNRYALLQTKKHKGETADLVGLSVYEWHKMQLQRLEKQIRAGGFVVRVKANLAQAGLNGAFKQNGQGVITIDRQGLTYKGNDADNQEISFFKPVKQLSRLSANLGKDLQVPYEDGSYWLTPEKGQSVILIKDALTVLDKLANDS